MPCRASPSSPRTRAIFTEALMAAVAQSAPEAKDRVRDFLDGKAAKVKKSLTAPAGPA